MDSLDKIQNGDYHALRKNEASRWVANDILRKGKQFKSYEALPPAQTGSGQPNNYRANFKKIPPDLQDNLEADAMRIQKMKMNLEGMRDLRM